MLLDVESGSPNFIFKMILERQKANFNSRAKAHKKKLKGCHVTHVVENNITSTQL